MNGSKIYKKKNKKIFSVMKGRKKIGNLLYNETIVTCRICNYSPCKHAFKYL